VNRRNTYFATIAVISVLTSGCFPEYDPPPELDFINVDQGLFDPSLGPLEIGLSEPIILKTLSVSLYLGRTDEDFRLCFPDTDGNLKPGCTEEAVVVMGPCSANPANASRELEESNGLSFLCEGGKIIVDETKRRVTIETDSSLAPFETYRVVIASGLSDEVGRTRKVPIEETFQVKSNIPCQPTSFSSGFYFSTFDIEAPARGQFHFLFWIEVNSETGQTKLYGSRLRPKDNVDSALNRTISDWNVDRDPATGSDIFATGQTAELGQESVFSVFPFTLSVNQPRILASSVELSGQTSLMSTDTSSSSVKVINGRLTSPQIFLGDGAAQSDLGSGYGSATMIEIPPNEAPTLSEGLPSSVSVEEVQAGFGPCGD